MPDEKGKLNSIKVAENNGAKVSETIRPKMEPSASVRKINKLDVEALKEISEAAKEAYSIMQEGKKINTRDDFEESIKPTPTPSTLRRQTGIDPT